MWRRFWPEQSWPETAVDPVLLGGAIGPVLHGFSAQVPPVPKDKQQLFRMRTNTCCVLTTSSYTSTCVVLYTTTENSGMVMTRIQPLLGPLPMLCEHILVSLYSCLPRSVSVLIPCSCHNESITCEKQQSFEVRSSTNNCGEILASYLEYSTAVSRASNHLIICWLHLHVTLRDS